jgi:hypothetical protein
MKRMACVIALATGTGVVLGATASPAHAEKTSALASGLQLVIASPSTVSGEATTYVDVSFQGGNIRSIELYVDGTLIKKQVIRTRDSRGVISFALDGLTEGDHEVLIKALDQDGNPASASSRLKVVPDVMDSLVQWKYPKKEEMVQGVVPIQIAVDRSVRNPYVTFLIDNDFLAFINLPPFTYNWDTSRLPNGSHTIGVEVYDGETLARVKTLTMKINVNNPGGKTMIQKDTPDLTKKPDKGGPLAPGILAAAESAIPKGGMALQSPGAKLFRVGEKMIAMPGNRVAGTQGRTNAKRTARPSLPNALQILTPGTGGNRVVPTPLTPDAADTLRNVPPTGANHTAFAKGVPPNGEKRVVVVPGLPPLCVQPQDVATLLTSDRKVSDLARVALRPRRAGNIAAMPTTKLGGSRAVATSQAPVLVRGTKPTVKATVVAGDLSTPGKSFAVAFDNQRIAFDVAPRVEKGLPLAPFRQIFEHTGGKVEWYKQSQTVRAFNSEREIEFRVGKKEAKVNNQSLEMERKPYLEGGRAIVPLSFVRDAMNVKVHYDAATGRMVIESNK